MPKSTTKSTKSTKSPVKKSKLSQSAALDALLAAKSRTAQEKALKALLGDGSGPAQQNALKVLFAKATAVANDAKARRLKKIQDELDAKHREKERAARREKVETAWRAVGKTNAPPQPVSKPTYVVETLTGHSCQYVSKSESRSYSTLKAAQDAMHQLLHIHAVGQYKLMIAHKYELNDPSIGSDTAYRIVKRESDGSFTVAVSKTQLNEWVLKTFGG